MDEALLAKLWSRSRAFKCSQRSRALGSVLAGTIVSRNLCPTLSNSGSNLKGFYEMRVIWNYEGEAGIHLTQRKAVSVVLVGEAFGTLESTQIMILNGSDCCPGSSEGSCACVPRAFHLGWSAKREVCARGEGCWCLQVEPVGTGFLCYFAVPRHWTAVFVFVDWLTSKKLLVRCSWILTETTGTSCEHNSWAHVLSPLRLQPFHPVGSNPAT